MQAPRSAPREDVEANERAALAHLTGPVAGELLAAALGQEGAEVSQWSVHEVHHRPGAGVSVGYSVNYTVDGTPHESYFVLSTAVLSADARARGSYATVSDGQWSVHAWRHPGDPELPALETACDPARVEFVATAAGLPVAPGSAEVELIGYRPTRRAVLRVGSGGHTWYLKILRPAMVERVHARHLELAAAGLPVPKVLAAHATGLLLLAQLPGTPLASALADDGAADLDPAHLLALLDALPGSVVELEKRASWSERIGFHGQAAAAVLPAERERIARVAQAVEAGSEAADLGPVVPTHGDFYEAQLLVDGGRVVGLLDVDTAGPGRRVDDLACMLGHLDVLPTLAPRVYPHVPQTVARWLAAFDGAVDPLALRVRTAGVVLSLVAGAATAAEALARLERAEAWLISAEKLSESTLIGVSSDSHRGPVD